MPSVFQQKIDDPSEMEKFEEAISPEGYIQTLKTDR